LRAPKIPAAANRAIESPIRVLGVAVMAIGMVSDMRDDVVNEKSRKMQSDLHYGRNELWN